MSNTALIEAAATLRDTVDGLTFAPPVAHTYNPLRYAWELHRSYLEVFGPGPKKILFLGMNPGPWGMAQTGVPFGEVAAVRDWMKLTGTVEQPAEAHPKRPVLGLDCPRSEVSGRRLWGLFAEKYPHAPDFFQEHFVINYCPLIWLGPTGANITPDKLPADERASFGPACDAHLRATLEILRPQHAIGVGGFAKAKLEAVSHAGDPWTISQVLHPSPASPAANRGWAEAASRTLRENGVWA